MAKKDLPKAPDVYEQHAGRAWLGPVTIPWSEKLPTVLDCRIEVRQSMAGMGPGKLSVVDWNHMAMFVNCYNPLCKGGGVSIGEMLEGAVEDGKTLFEQNAVCIGKEPMGRRTTRPCTNYYRVKGTVTYKPS